MANKNTDSKNDNSISVLFVKEKETKNAVRFEEKAEAGKPNVIGSLYVQKWAIGDATEIVVTLNIGK